MIINLVILVLALAYPYLMMKSGKVDMTVSYELD